MHWDLLGSQSSPVTSPPKGYIFNLAGPLTHCLFLENHITSQSVNLFTLSEMGNAICITDV